ncbi:hypothetical protein B0H19DRAFT_1142957 [Mycena capillaripes]|nr:hypothetical protein B0H19DRAFT_1142957 [Mycena capillaripes]
MAHMFFAITGITNRQTDDFLNCQSTDVQALDIHSHWVFQSAKFQSKVQSHEMSHNGLEELQLPR